MRGVWTAVFWAALLPLAWVYAGYPALLLLRRRWRRRPVALRSIHPLVSVIVAAHDEEATIPRKIRSTLELAWPADRLEVVIVSDGSTDRTASIVAGWGDDRVRLVELERVGKAGALNAGAAAARGEVLVFTDANAELSRDVLAHLVEPLADPAVGGVCGRKRIRTGRGHATAEGEGLYWRIEDRLKRLESESGSVVAADGGLYAVRRSLYVPIDDPAQADDMAVSMRVVLQDRRLVYEPEAVAVEDAPPGAGGELRRKVRVTNHSMRALLGLGTDLWTSGFYSVQLVSHKLLRHLGPLFLLALLPASVALAPGSAFYGAATAAQAILYGLAFAGALLRHTRLGAAAPFAAPFWFVLVHLAALLGVLSVLTGRRIRSWTPRGGASESDAFTTPQGGIR